MDGDSQDSTQDQAPTVVHEDTTPVGRRRVSFGRQKFALLPDEPGMVGYLARKYVVTDRGSFFTNGFATETIVQTPAVPHLYQHWSDLVIGVNKTPIEDAKGLKVTAVLNEANQLAAEVMSTYRFGDVHGWVYDWSIGFDPIEDRTAKDAELPKLDFSGAPEFANATAADLRAITKIRWGEGSTVTWGAIHNAGPDVIHTRQAVETTDGEMLELFAGLRTGRLSPIQRRRLEVLLVAKTGVSAAGTDHGSHEHSDGRPDRRSELALAYAGWAKAIVSEYAL